MSIPLPPIPPLPNADSTPEVWGRYLQIVGLHAAAEQSELIASNTAAMAAAVASQAQFLATLNATPDGVAFGDVLKLVGMLLRMPVEPAPGG